MRRSLVLALSLLVGSFIAADSKPSSRSEDARNRLRPFNDLIGTWRTTGIPEGNRRQRQKGFWVAKAAWSWKFDGPEAWLEVKFTDDKYFQNGQLQARPDSRYRLTLRTTTGEQVYFDGRLKDRILSLERTDPKSQEQQRLVLRLLHHNRFVYRYEVKKPGRQRFRRVYQVGATKEGTAFATRSKGPECIVTGGLGTMPVTYKGQTYYVCCTGCREAFNDDPERYIREFQAKKRSSK